MRLWMLESCLFWGFSFMFSLLKSPVGPQNEYHKPPAHLAVSPSFLFDSPWQALAPAPPMGLGGEWLGAGGRGECGWIESGGRGVGGAWGGGSGVGGGDQTVRKGEGREEGGGGGMAAGGED